MSDTSVSTRVASELLSVHESSIKRWCNAGELSCWSTPGGHRRIPISKLVRFASEHGLEGKIVDFGPAAAERVWVGLEMARRDSNFSVLDSLFFEWVNLGKIDLVELGMSFLMDQGIGLGTIFDDVLRSAMSRVGAAYSSQQLSIGDEHRLTNLVRDSLMGLRRLLKDSPGAGEGRGLARPTAIVGCVRDEAHEIGALMIRLVLTKAGWNVIYLGQDVPTEEFYDQSVKHDADLICISVAPPRGNPEAMDAAQLLSRLFTNGRRIALAIGGSRLTEAPPESLGEHFSDVRFFTRATPFEEWINQLPE